MACYIYHPCKTLPTYVKFNNGIEYLKIDISMKKSCVKLYEIFFILSNRNIFYIMMSNNQKKKKK